VFRVHVTVKGHGAKISGTTHSVSVSRAVKALHAQISRRSIRQNTRRPTDSIGIWLKA
jgi:hypothetical protein